MFPTPLILLKPSSVFHLTRCAKERSCSGVDNKCSLAVTKGAMRVFGTQVAIFGEIGKPIAFSFWPSPSRHYESAGHRIVYLYAV